MPSEDVELYFAERANERAMAEFERAMSDPRATPLEKCVAISEAVDRLSRLVRLRRDRDADRHARQIGAVIVDAIGRVDHPVARRVADAVRAELAGGES